MTQSRRPAGIPTGGQFAPVNRPAATGLGLCDEAAGVGRRVSVKVKVGAGVPSFAVEGPVGRDGREIRDRVRAAMLSSGLAWPMGKVVVRVDEPAPPRTADLDLEIALGLLRASGQIPDAGTDGVRGELGLDGSIRGDATTDVDSLGQLVDWLKAGETERGDQARPTNMERCRSLASYATAIGHLVDELGDDVSVEVEEAIKDAEEIFGGIWDALQAEKGATKRAPAAPPSDESVSAASTAETARTEAAAKSWRLFRESYASWLDSYRKSLVIGGRSDTERRLREAAGLAGVDAEQLRDDKARSFNGETSAQILEGR